MVTRTKIDTGTNDERRPRKGATTKSPARASTPLRNAVLLDEAIAADRERCLAELRASEVAVSPSAASPEKYVQLSVRVPAEVRQQVRDAATALDQPVQLFVLDALRARLRRIELSGELSPELTAFAKDMLEMVRSGEYRKEVESWDDPDVVTQ